MGRYRGGKPTCESRQSIDLAYDFPPKPPRMRRATYNRLEAQYDDLENRWVLGIMSRFETCVDYYAAAATYEQLARLSDFELHRRGLSRATLGRDVCGRRQLRGEAFFAAYNLAQATRAG